MDTATPQMLNLEEWRLNNQRLFNQSDNARAEWFRINEQSKQLISEKDVLTKVTQDAATKDLAKKARETREWKNNLERVIEDITKQIQRLELLKNRLINVMDRAQIVGVIARECLDIRAGRVSTDLVEDGLQRELEKEAELAENYRNLTHRYIAEAESQLQRDHAAKMALEKDWSDKWEAYNIDTTCGMMKMTSSDQIAYYAGPENIKSKWSTPNEWIEFTRGNIKLGNIEIEATIALSNMIEDHLKKGAEALQKQSDIVEAAFADRNNETNDSLYRLKEHLRLVQEDIVQAEKTINRLRKALLEKEPALKKVQTRLHLRNARPNVELCQDPAYFSLIEESRILACTIQGLQEQLSRAEAVLKNLLETRRDLEREIGVKENTVLLDQTRCSRVRKKYPQKQDLMGY